jgi:hypothetical protein
MQRLVRVRKIVKGIKCGPMFRPQFPHPVDDTFGMMMTVALLDHFLNAGVHETTV